MHSAGYVLAALLATFTYVLGNGCDVATGSGDVHIHHAAGGILDFKGHDGVFNLLQAKNFSVNAKFELTNYTLSPLDPRSLDTFGVMGSHLTKAYITVDTGEGVLTVFYSAGLKQRAHLTSDKFDLLIGKDDGPVRLGDTTVNVQDAAPIKVVVTSSEWQLIISPGSFRTFPEGALRTRIDVSIKAITDPLVALVAPHGIMGQGFDGLRIHGKTDNYVPDENGVFVTSANGEGAIEGTPEDYSIDLKDPFSTHFKFGRFNAAKAAPRNTSGLNLPTGSASPPSLKGSVATTTMEEGTAGRRLAGCDPTPAPVNAPTPAPVNAPTPAPVNAPTPAPVNRPTAG